MRRHRARTSRLRHRLPAHEIILFRLLPRSSLARRRLALDTARIPFARPHAVRAPPPRRFHPRIRPARLRGAAAIGEIDQGIIPHPVPARARWRRRDATVEPETWRAQTRHSRGLNSFPRRLSRPLSTSRARRRARRLSPRRAKKNSLASLNPLAGRRADRARACAATNPRRPRTNGWVVGFHWSD